MKTKFTLVIFTAVAIASLSMVSACASFKQTQPSAGYIAEVGTSQVRLCFRSGISPSPGQEVQFMSNAQTPRPSFRSARPVGVARITAAGADGCVLATVLNGTAQRNDDVNLPSVQD